MLSDLLRPATNGIYADPSNPYGTINKNPLGTAPTPQKAGPINTGTLPPPLVDRLNPVPAAQTWQSPTALGVTPTTLTDAIRWTPTASAPPWSATDGRAYDQLGAAPPLTGKTTTSGMANVAPDLQGNDQTPATTIPNPTAVDPFAQQVQALYARYGRVASAAEIDSHRGNPGGLPAIEAMLASASSSTTASQTQTAATGDSPSGWDNQTLRDKIAAQLALTHSTDDPAYWFRTLRASSKGNDWAYWAQRMDVGDGADGSRGRAGSGGDGAYGGSSVNLPDNLLDPWNQTYVDPDYKAGDAPVYKAPDVPVIDPWKAPTAGDLTQDPSYQWRLQQGLGAIQNSRSAQRTSRTGSALQALNDYAGHSAAQEFSSVWDRSKSVYDTGVANKFAAWKDQMDKSSAEYAPSLLTWQAANADATRRNALAYQQYQDSYNAWRDHQAFLADTLFRQSSLGIQAAN